MSTKVLLYVEDNPGDVALLGEALTSLASSIPIALRAIPHGSKALAYLQEKVAAQEPPADLILLDVHLPGKTGIELWHYIAAESFLSKTRTWIYQMRDVPLLGIPHQAQVAKPDSWEGFLALADRIRVLLETSA